MARASSDEIVFRGPPRRLRLASELPALLDAHFEPDEALASTLSRSRPFRARADGEGRLRGARMRFDRSTPPGEYRATLRSADSTVPVRIHVEPAPRLGITPGALSFRAAEGSKPQASVLFTNKGNVELEIPRAVTVSLCRDEALKNALTSALLLDTNRFDEVFSHIIDRLRKTHGGLLPLTFIEGSGKLAAGRQVAALARAEFSPKLAAGHSYHGIVAIQGTRLGVAVTVTA